MSASRKAIGISVAATVFLDWFGTLADREEMSRRFRAVLAEVLQERFGGQIADALRRTT